MRTIIKTKTAGWFFNPETGKNTRKQDGDKIVTADEWNDMQVEAKDEQSQEKVILSSGKVAHGPTTTINCKAKGCDATRVIQVQDKFQVKFCIEHQREERNRLRRERRAAKAKAKG
jgi:adenine-specific DNA methylase